MATTDKTEKKNGGARPGSGMPKGTKTKKVLEREAQLAAYQQLVFKRLKPIFEHQYSLIKGVSYLYRIDEGPNGAKEHIIVSDPDEIGDILAQMHDGEDLLNGVYNDKYYYITVKPPENAAIKDMLDRAIGKATNPLPGDENKIEEVTVIKYAR
jgi:hypothetical protein